MGACKGILKGFWGVYFFVDFFDNIKSEFFFSKTWRP